MKQMNFIKKSVKTTLKQHLLLTVKFLMKSTLFAALIVTTGVVQAESNSKKVLMVVSGNGHSEKEGEEKPGYEFGEFSKAYAIFKENGITVDIASPKGGEVEADKYNPEKTVQCSCISR